MLIKRYFVTLLVTLILQMAQAQRLFNELFLQPHQTTFTLNAPQQPILRLYADGEGGKPLQQYKMRAAGKHRWTLTLKRLCYGRWREWQTRCHHRQGYHQPCRMGAR